MSNKTDLSTEENNTESTNLVGTYFTPSDIKLFPFLVGAIYFFGFVVTNSNLWKYGIVDLSIASTEHLTAGIVFAVYIIVYFLFAGQFIMGMKRSQWKEITDYYQKGVWPPFFGLIFLRTFISYAFTICLSAGFFSWLAFREESNLLFASYLIVAYLIVSFLDAVRLDYKYPQIATTLQIIFEISTILVFAYFSPTSAIIVALAYGGISFYINLTFDDYERRGFDTKKVIFTLVYSSLFFLGTALSFGTFIYSHVSRSVGGGKPFEARVIMSQEVQERFQAESNINFNENVKIVQSSENFMYLANESITIRLPTSVIDGVIYSRGTKDAEPTAVTPNEAHGADS